MGPMNRQQWGRRAWLGAGLWVAVAACAPEASSDSAVPASPARVADGTGAAPPVAVAGVGVDVQTPTYTLDLAVPTAVGRGGAAQAQIVLVARGGYHINREYPTAFRPEGTDGALGFAGDRLALGEGRDRQPCATHGGPSAAEDFCGATYDVAFSPTTPGPTTLAGELAFSVCNPEQCLIEKVRLQQALRVE